MKCLSRIYMEGWQWIFVFFAIMIAVRIIPRFLRGRKGTSQANNFQSKPEPPLQTNDRARPEQPFEKRTKPESKDMLVLGELNHGTKTFENIKKKTQLESDELNSILESLENQGLMRVNEKKGLFGIKIELLPTEKGFKEYNS